MCWIKALNERFITHTTFYDFSACPCIWRSLKTESVFLFSVSPCVLPIGDTQYICQDSINKWGHWLGGRELGCWEAVKEVKILLLLDPLLCLFLPNGFHTVTSLTATVYLSLSSTSRSIPIYLQSNWLVTLSLTLVFLNHPSFIYSLKVSSVWFTHYQDICWVKTST